MDIVDEVLAGFARHMPEIDALDLEVICRVIVAGKIMEASAVQTLRSYDLGYSDFDVLGMLRSAPPPHESSPADLMRLTMLSSGAMTACIVRLEKAGLVTRRQSVADKRVRIIALTPKGKGVIDRAYAERIAAARSRLAQLSEDEKRKVSSLLKRLSAEP